MKTLLHTAAIVTALLSAPAWAQTAAVKVEGAWARASVQGQKATGAFMRLTAKDGARLVRAECVNATPRNQNMVLHLVGCMNFPARGYDVELLPGAKWIPALDYKDLTYATPRPTDSLVYDGLQRGEASDPQFTGGWGIGKGFGMGNGDRVDYEYTLDEPIHNAALLVRARLPKGAVLETSLGTLRGTGEFTVTRFSCQS